MGCCSYGGKGSNTYELELLDNQDKSLQKINGNFGPTDDGSLVTMKFEKDVQIKPNIVYTLTLLVKGCQIKSDGRGQDSVTGPDGTKFVFSESVLSVNGTNTERGQIPLIQYFSEAEKGYRLQVCVFKPCLPESFPPSGTKRFCANSKKTLHKSGRTHQLKLKSYDSKM